MTVGELIEKLKAYPDDYLIVNVYEEEIFDIEVDDEERLIILND